MPVSLRPARPWIVGVGVAAAAAATFAGVPASAAPAATSSPPATATVTHLITGDVVSLRQLPDGRRSVNVTTTARSGPAAAWSSAQLASRSYVFPAIAKPYLGRVLDPSLFEITGDTGRVPVDLAFPAGTRPSMPGFVTTSSTSTSARGYLTVASARTFGAALLARFEVDASPGHTPAATLFGASRISRPGAAAPARPAFPQVTLRVSVRDADGSPADFAAIGLLNTDDGRRYNGFLFVSGGEARVSVPLGHYSAIAEAGTFDPNTLTYTDAIVTVPDTTVSADQQRLAIDMADATVTPSVSTPKPAAVQEFGLEWDRFAAGIGSSGFAFGYGPGSAVKVAPAPAPRIGRAEWLTSWTLTASPAHALPYRYDLTFDDSGAIPAEQHRLVDASQLARLDSSYHTDGPARLPLFGRTALYPFQFAVFSSLDPQPGPLSRTEYVGGPPSAAWFATYVAVSTDVNFLGGLTSDGFRVYPAGSRQTVDWLRGPLAPGVDSPTNGTAGFYSTACRTADRIAIALPPFTDSTPGHVGSAFVVDPSQVVASFRLEQDGTLVRGQKNSTGGVFPASARASVYEATVATSLDQNDFATSTHAVTTLTFRSGAGTGAPLPNGWQCAAGSDATVLPLLKATIPLPTDLANTMPLGPNTFAFTIAPAPGAPAAAVLDATVETSVDGGATFVAAPVTTAGSNRFTVTLVNPAKDAGRPVTLRVAGRTAAGSAISETITNAYVIQGS